MPLYFDLQLYRVALEIPNSLLTNSADTPLSNDFTARTISLSLCAFFFITLLIKQIYHFCLIILRLNYREGYILIYTCIIFVIITIPFRHTANCVAFSKFGLIVFLL